MSQLVGDAFVVVRSMARDLDGLEFMSDPIPAISESEATGLIAEIYADIRSVYRVGVVNLIWRHLATIPGGLPWVWSTIRPLYVNGTVGREATALRAALSLPELRPWPTAALMPAGLQHGELPRFGRYSLPTIEPMRWLDRFPGSAISARKGITARGGGRQRPYPSPS